VSDRKTKHRSFLLLGLTIVTLTAFDVEAQTLINVPADYSTVQAAFNAASDGDTILVAPGTYQEAIDMADKSVVLASWFLTTQDTSYVSQTILDGNGSSAVITIQGSVGPSTTIIGFTIQNASDGISARAKSDILNCRIRNTSDGIDYEAGSGGLCKFNIFENNGDDGIDLDNEVDIVIEENIIRNNGDDGIEIRLQPYNGPLLNHIIRNNEIYGNGEDGIQLIDYDTLSDRLFIIERNLIYNNVMAGIGCMGGANTKENFEGASIPERIYLFNNTFVANNYGVTGGDSLVAVNNIFVDHPGIAMKNVDGGSIVSYGIYWNNGTDFENCNVDNPNILFSDPLLDSQFHLQPASPAIDAGAALFIWQGDAVLNLPSTSYSGVAPDLGAFEFNGIPSLSLSIDDVSADEGVGTMTFTVSLSAVSGQDVSVDFTATDVTAVSPDDYTGSSGTLTIPMGSSSGTIAVTIIDDGEVETAETFTVDLSNAVNASISDNQGVGTITDNDGGGPPVTASFQDGVDGYSGTRDTRLLANSSNTNYGSSTRLDVDGSPDESTLLYWDVTSIPLGSTIESVDITVNVTNKSGDDYEFYELQRAWVESEARLDGAWQHTCLKYRD
jgi:hypothetical protein